MFFSKHAVTITLPPPLFSFSKHSLYLFMAFDLSFRPPPCNQPILFPLSGGSARSELRYWLVGLLPWWCAVRRWGSLHEPGQVEGGRQADVPVHKNRRLMRLNGKVLQQKTWLNKRSIDKKLRLAIIPVILHLSITYSSITYPFIPPSITHSCIKPIISVIHPSIHPSNQPICNPSTFSSIHNFLSVHTTFIHPSIH